MTISNGVIATTAVAEEMMRSVFLSTLLSGLLAIGFAASQARSAEDTLIAAAKKEGRAVWYTTQIINQFVQPAAAAFEKRYGVRVEYVRKTANDLTLALLNESKGGKIQADIFDGTTSAAVLKKEGVALRWLPDSAKRLPEQFQDKEGYWVATNLYVLTPAVNTDLVPPGTEPKTFTDLLDPKWKGKIVWNSSPSNAGAGGVVGIVLAAMGEQKGMDYLRRLADQEMIGVFNASRAGLDAVMAGEYSIALNTFNNHSIISRAQGAPVNWIPMQPAMAILSVASVTKGGPHPNAGKLLVDFLVSSEGQGLYRDADYIPVDPDVTPRYPALRPDSGRFKAIYFTPEEAAASLGRWMKIFKEIFG